MNLTRVNYFLTLCHTLHFTNAARSLGISQPALTKAINQLEIDLGTRLIRREGKSTHLTRNGVVVREKFAALMQDVQRAETELNEVIHGGQGLIKLAVARTINFKKIALFIAEFHKIKLETSFEIFDCSLQECEGMLCNGEVDCALTINRKELQDQFYWFDLYKERLGGTTTIPSNNESNNNENSVAEILEQEGINTNESIEPLSYVYAISENYPRAVAKCTQELWIQQLIKAGLGYGVSELTSDTINGLQVGHEPNLILERQICAALPAGRNDNPLINCFVQFIKQYKWQ